MRGARSARRIAPPLEHRVLMTAALCLIAFGAVMVYSASSPIGVLGGSGNGNGTGEFFQYLMAAGIGLVFMNIAERRGLDLFNARLTRLMLLGSMALLVLVMLPGFGVSINGARRWFAAGPIQFQPSELVKLALILHVARYLADHPKRLKRGFKQAVGPVVLVMAPCCLLIVKEPDLGTTLVVVFSLCALLIASGHAGPLSPGARGASA